MKEGWYCHGCQRHHGPHVDTCPGFGSAVGVQTIRLSRPGYGAVGWDGRTTPTFKEMPYNEDNMTETCK